MITLTMLNLVFDETLKGERSRYVTRFARISFHRGEEQLQTNHRVYCSSNSVSRESCCYLRRDNIITTIITRRRADNALMLRTCESKLTRSTVSDSTPSPQDDDYVRMASRSGKMQLRLTA